MTHIFNFIKSTKTTAFATLKNMAIYTWYKNIGETPLESIERMRKEQNIEPGVPMTYAGRLDPIAEGILLVLVGEDCKKKDEYLGLYKTYKAEFLVGFSTDTYDILGRLSQKGVLLKAIDWKSELQKLIGEYELPYPPYSSKTVNGKPLFEYARAGILDTIKIPTYTARVFKVENISVLEKSSEEILTLIGNKINSVKGDFRQKETLIDWQQSLGGPTSKWQILSCEISCGSGTYIRSLVNELGKNTNTPVCLLSLLRTKIGEYS